MCIALFNTFVCSFVHSRKEFSSFSLFLFKINDSDTNDVNLNETSTSFRKR